MINERAADEFASEIEFELDLAEDEFRTAVRAISLEALKRIVLKTPVDTGRARGNWQVAIGSAGTEVLDVEDETGDETIAAGAAILERYRTQIGFPVIALFNNLSYILKLENGFSKRAPRGMVGITLSELQPEVA